MKRITIALIGIIISFNASATQLLPTFNNSVNISKETLYGTWIDQSLTKVQAKNYGLSRVRPPGCRYMQFGKDGKLRNSTILLNQKSHIECEETQEIVDAISSLNAEISPNYDVAINKSDNISLLIVSLKSIGKRLIYIARMTTKDFEHMGVSYKNGDVILYSLQPNPGKAATIVDVGVLKKISSEF